MAVRSARVRIDLITEFSNSAKSSKVDKSIAVEGAVRLKTCSKFTVILAIISFGFGNAKDQLIIQLFSKEGKKL